MPVARPDERDATVAADARPKRRRLPGVTLRPGSVKQARVDSGLSLAQLGKGQVTAPAIYLIETGRTRPSLPTLEHIARRTGKPVEYFLADPAGTVDGTQAAMAELEASVAAGRYEEAVALGRSLLDGGVSAHGLGRIRYFLAQAYFQLGQTEKAETLLVEARAHFEAVNDWTMLAECLGTEAALASMLERPDAVAVAEKALATCRSLDPVPATMESRLIGVLATAHLVRHEWDRALELYRESIEVGAAVFDLRRQAELYERLSAACRAVGQIEAASRYATRSVALREVLRDQVALASSEQNLELILMAKGDETSAREHLDRLDGQLDREAELRAGRSHVLLSLCALCLQQDNRDRAAGFAREALALATAQKDSANVAEAHVWLGRIAAQAGDHEVADREFELAIEGYERLDLRERLLRSHGAYAEALEQRGELSKAYVHMKLALQASRPGLMGVSEQTEERAYSA